MLRLAGLCREFSAARKLSCAFVLLQYFVNIYFLHLKVAARKKWCMEKTNEVFFLSQEISNWCISQKRINLFVQKGVTWINSTVAKF